MWIEINGYEGYYCINEIGTIKSLERVIKINYGTDNFRLIKEKIIKESTDKNGYLLTKLSINGIRKTYKVHRLVASHFIDNPNNKPEVNHKNGIKDDNRVENLEWSTSKENSIHARETGLTHVGEKIYCSKLTNDDVLNIVKLRNEGKKLKEISMLYPVGFKTISKIVNGDRWSHITKIKRKNNEDTSRN